MKVTLDEKILQTINFFQRLTGASITDCIDEDDALYFVVLKGHYGMAVGKNGEKIKKAEALFKKSIRIFEFADTPEEFLRNVVPEAKKIEVKDETIEISVNSYDRPKIIGKNGSKIKILNQFVERLYEKKVIRLLTPVRM